MKKILFILFACFILTSSSAWAYVSTDNPFPERDSTAAQRATSVRFGGVSTLEGNYHESQLIALRRSHALYQRQLAKWQRDVEIARYKAFQEEQKRRQKILAEQNKQRLARLEKERRERERYYAARAAANKQARISEPSGVEGEGGKITSSAKKKPTFWSHFSRALFGK